MRYFEVIMKNGKKNYLSYDTIEIQKNEISKVIKEIDRNDYLYYKKALKEGIKQ